MCLDAGVNLIDTADVYSDGVSEEIVGKTLKGRRDRVLLATKARFAMGDGPNDAGLSRHHIIRACEASLRRLGTDYIDLYQVHEWDGATPLEETLDALDHLVDSGKVRYIGCSNYAGWQLMKALGISERRGYQRFVSQQIHYSLQARDAEYELVPAGLDQGVGILVWSPLAGGLLSGKYRRDQDMPEGSRHLTDWNEPPVHDEDQLYDIVEVLVEIAEARGVSAAQVALAWTLGRPGVATGDRRRAHRGAARRQPRRRRPGARGRRARPARRGQRAAADVPVLASGQVGRRAPERGGPHAPGSARLSGRPTAYWLKAVGHARGPLAEDWLETRPELLRRTGFPRRPRIAPGDRLVMYASVWRRVFAIAQVLGEPEPRDHPRWPWTIAIETLLVVPVLDAAPPVEAIGVAARSMSQQSHISIRREHYDRAIEAITSIAA